MTCSFERFQEDTKNHTVEIKKDDGVYRHLTVSHNGSSVYRYDIVTWPGHLCVTGDMGSYTFARLDDMFDFFRSPDYKINPPYWGEKLEAIGTNAGYQKFDIDKFGLAFKEHFADFRNDEMDDEDSDWDAESLSELWETIEDEILATGSESEESVYNDVYNFRYEAMTNEGELLAFTYDAYDLFEGGYNSFTHRYIWGLYSIVHAIKLYDGMTNDA